MLLPVTSMLLPVTNCAVQSMLPMPDMPHFSSLLSPVLWHFADDGINLGPQEIYNYLCRVMYNRRNKFDPLWNSFIIAGTEPTSDDATDSSSSSFLGMVGMIGTHYTDSHVTTGFANHLARPLFREKQSDDMSEEAAVELMHEALRVCYYR